MEQYYLRNREKIRAQQKEYHKQQHAIELLRAKSERWRRAHGIMPRTKGEKPKKEPKEKKLKYKRRDKKAEQEKLEKERREFIESYDFVMVF
tara:strand:- start:97 stop:372 length:276 start_codon:yes stop_codon:yes gene_type:complete